MTAPIWTRVVAALLIASVANAQPAAGAASKVTVAIKAQPVREALQAFGRQTGMQVLFRSEGLSVEGVKTPAVAGELSAQEALERLLTSTGLTYEFVNERTVRVSSASLSTGAKRTPDQESGRDTREADYLAQAETSSSSSAAGAENTGASQRDENGSSKGDSTGDLEEIIVTATKREVKLQDVPFGISALSTENLERIGAASAQDYLANVPGTYFSTRGRGLSPIIMRGVSTEGNNINNLQRTTEYYLDEIPLLDRFSTWVGIDVNTFDIERVEVLRGPQGTLFGSGAMGGAVRVITNKPDTSQFASKIELGQAFTYGGDESNSIQAMINVPLSDDKLAARFVGYVDNTGGWIDNTRSGDENVNDGRVEGGRLMLRYTPIESLDVLFSAIFEDTKVDDSDRSFHDGPDDQWNGAHDEPFTQSLEAYNLTINYDFDWASLTSASTYAKRESLLFTNFTQLVQPLFPNYAIDPVEDSTWITHPSERFAQELRLVSGGEGRLDWTVGGFFMNFKTDIREAWDIDDSFPYRVLVPLEVSEKALFGEVTYHLTDKVHLTAGGRYFDNVYETEIISSGDVLQVPAPFTQTDSSGFTPKLSLSFFPTDDVHLYATASEGYRVGQANFSWAAAPAAIPKGYDPDSLWNYELGAKSSFLDNRLQANVAAFYIDWKDLQLQRFARVPGIDFPINFTDNAGTAEINGVEAEFALRPTAAWEIGSSVTLLDTELTSVLPGVTLTVGSKLPGSPETTISTYLQYNAAQLPNDMSGYFRLGHRYVGKVYFDINNTIPDSISDSYQILDFRTGIYWDRYELALYADNLSNDTDSIVAADLVNGTPLGGAFRLRPRTIGLTLRASF